MEYKVSDIADINTNSIKKDNMPEIIYYLDTANITDGKVNNVVKYIPNEDKVPSRARRKIKENDILISTVRPNQRHYGFIDKSLANLIVSTGFAVLSPHTDRVDPYYLYLVLTSSSFTQTLQNIAEDSTSAYPSIKPSVIGDQILNLPSTKVQKRISSFVKSIDSKISLNLSTIANLEELSQTIFKRWFIDFEFPDENGNPYKSSGGKLVDSELGDIPEGWKVSELNELLINKKDTVKPGEYTRTHPYVPIDIIPMKKLNFYEYKSGIEAKSSLIKFEENDILLGSMRVYFHRVCLAPYKGTTRSTVFVLKPKEKYLTYYSLLFLYQNDFITFAANTSSGSTIPYAVWNETLENYPTIMPSVKVLKSFNCKVNDYFMISRNLLLENENLKKLRDTLLPKLMSGEIEIPENLEV